MSFGDGLKKHYLRMIERLLGGRSNKQVFNLVSPIQNVGKTTFLQYLQPPQIKHYCVETLEGRKENRDRLLSSKAIILCDEGFNIISSKGGDADAKFKAMVSQTTATYFCSFKQEVKTVPAISSFFMSCNLPPHGGIYSDDTGSSRFVTYNVEHIDFAYEEIHPDDLFAWAYKEYLSGERGHFTPEENEANMAYNDLFKIKKQKKKAPIKKTSKIKKQAIIAAVAASLLPLLLPNVRVFVAQNFIRLISAFF